MMMLFSRLFARSEGERCLDNRLLTALIRQAGWEIEPAQRVVNYLATRRFAQQPIHPAQVTSAIEDELRAQRPDGSSPPPAEISWAVTAVEQALASHEQGAS